MGEEEYAWGPLLLFVAVRPLQITVAMTCEGDFLPSSDDPVAVRMVSDKSTRRRVRADGVVNSEASAYLGVVSLVVVFAGAAVTTIVSLAAFVAVYVYIEAVR